MAMGLFVDSLPGRPVEVPGILQSAGGRLQPISFPAPMVPTPADENIQPAEGDDTSAPNATTAARLNRVVCVSSANVGYSKAAKDTQVLPSALEYDATVEEGSGPGEFAMTLRMTLEYESAFPEEGMVVWVKKHQQVISDEQASELLLIETAFEDYVGGRWVPITTDVRYAEEAEAVVQAVITSDSGQTAGRVSTTGAVEDAKLGPVGERGRIVLTYRCERLYSYAEMDLGAGSLARSLVPLGLQLPWAAFDNPGNRCGVRAVVRAPSGTVQLDPQANILAYRDLHRSLAAQGPTPGGEAAAEQSVVLPELSSRVGELPEWQFACQSLPPKPTMVFAWLSVPSADEGWEQVDSALPKTTRATILKASEEDSRLLKVSPPGGLDGHLVRCQVDTEAPTRQPDSVRVHTDITISDASGSTGMTANRQAGGGESVRERFNKHEERRMLTRLEAIPKLREAGILLDNDVWCQIFVIFDHGVKHEFGIEAQIRDLDTATVAHLVKALADSDAAAISALEQSGKANLLNSWRQALTQLRAVRAGGTTSFVAGADKARQSYQAVKNKYRSHACTTYVNFDTDGGNNCGPCYDSISSLVEQADVVQGHVLGVGAWVDQDCAARVARLLKGSTSLALAFPESAGADQLFRQDLSRWIKALRTIPVTLTVSAGSRVWSARHGVRNENGADCLFALGDGVSFDAPDVSSMEFTKAVVRGLKAGESATLYLLSRWTPAELVSNLEIMVGGVRAQVALGADQFAGVALGHHWLSVLGGSGSPEGIAENKAALCSRLRHRLEDDLSFAWNLPTKSGSTAAVGRAKTEQRPPVSKEQQPEEPEAPKLTTPSSIGGFGFGVGGGLGASPWGMGSRSLQVRDANAVFGGGAGGCPGGSWGAPMMMCAAAPAPPMCAAPGASGVRSARSAAAAPRSMQQQQGGGMFGQNTGPSPSGGLFGAPSGPPPYGGQGRGAKGMRKSSQAESKGGGDGPSTPSVLLRGSSYMHWGASETPSAALVRGVAALKHVANSTLSPPKAGPGAAPEAEDPLVGDLLGPSAGGGGRAPGGGGAAAAGAQAVHYGFVCDATQQGPILGVRFKASDKFDIDVAEEARRVGKFAGGAGFKPIPDSTTAMRWALAAVLAWWPLVWWKRAALFQAQTPDLSTLGAPALCQAIINLPDDAEEKRD